MRRWFFATAFVAATASAAMGQTAAPMVQSPPTDIEIEQARGKLLEGQIGYLAAIVRRAEAELGEFRGAARRNLDDPKATAAWWTAYAAESKEQKK